MKKIVSIIVLCALLACCILECAVSAAGDILWKEDFSSADPNNWMWDGTAFFIEDGVLKGWDEAKVHQSKFLSSEGGTRKYKESAWRIDAIGYEDGGADAETHRVGFWYADYIDPAGTDDPTSWIVYKPLYCFETQMLELEMEFTGDEAEAFKPANYPDDSVVLRKQVTNNAPTLGGDWFTMGIRINAGVVSLFVNDEKIVDFPAYRGTTTCTERPSPVLLLNGGCYCGFDNLVVSTPDYDLFNEGANMNQQGGGQQGGGQQGGGQQGGGQQGGGTEKVIVKKSVVVGTDANGNAITEIVTEEVVRQVAATGGSATGGNAAKTGDTAIIVIAVMITALGSALVVWKVRSK